MTRGASRLLALLSLQEGRCLHRGVAWERLWPSSPSHRASSNLRSALWGANQVDEVIEARGPRLQLAASVEVDLHSLLRRVRDPNRARWDDDELRTTAAGLTRGLLPDWSDDWLTLRREHWDHVRLHELERLAQELQQQERYLAALETAMDAVALEPIREVAHRVIIEVHLAEGNKGSALQHYQRYRLLLQREMGVEPSARMDEIVRALRLP